MVEETSEGEGRNDLAEEGAGRADRLRIGPSLSIAILCIAAAAMILVAVIFFLPPEQALLSQPDTSKAAAAPQSPPGSAAPRASAPQEPTVMLATAPVPASAEAMQAEAQRASADLLASFPEQAEAVHVAAMTHAQLRQTAEAQRLWQKCIELAPQSEQYRVNLAVVAMDRGNSELAAQTLQELTSAGSKSPEVLHHLALALSNLGRNEQAVQTIQQALAAQPRYAAGWLVLGQTQLKGGDPADAETSLRKAIDLGIHSADAYFALATACARQGKEDEAAGFRKQYDQLSASQPLAARERFQVLSSAEARRTAVVVLTEAAIVYSRLQDPAAAENLLLRAIALDPASVASCRTLAELYMVVGRPADERVVRRRLVEIEPYSFENCVDLAKVSAQLGDESGAEAALKLALAVRPEAVAHGTLAQFYLQAGKAKEAHWHAQQAARLKPTAEAYVFLASTCRLLGANDEAEAAMAEARKLQGGKAP
jgi:tetratricopeptide (TPR) repeat protein